MYNQNIKLYFKKEGLNMKKLLSILLCLAMVLSMFTVASYAEETTDSDTEKLEMLGFALDPGSYNLNALKPGKHIIDTKYELLFSETTTDGSSYNGYSYIEKFKKEYYTVTSNVILGLPTTISTTKLNFDYDSTEIPLPYNKNPYEVSAPFDPNGSGKDEYLARIALDDVTHNLMLYFSRIDATATEILAEVKIGSVETASEIKMWLVEGLLSLVAGDFDGDSKEEIAVYAPDNLDEQIDTSNELNILIRGLDTSDFSVIEKQDISLTDMGDSGKECTWNHSFVDGKKQYYSIPFVALTADDVNGDGIDDLMTVMNFSTRHKGIAEDERYTTEQVIDQTTCFASLLSIYEGTDGGNLVNSVLHKPLIANGPDDDYRYVLRHANAVVADVTAEGSREIVFGGNYTKIEYKNATGTTLVNKNRNVYRYDDLVFGNIIGFADYNTVKAYQTHKDGAAYNWALDSKGNSQLHHYLFSDNNPIQQPVSLCGYKFNGFGQPDRIFLAGNVFEYDSTEGVLKKIESMGKVSELSSGYTNKWLGKAVAANCIDDNFGTEILAVPLYGKVDGKEKYTSYIVYAYPDINQQIGRYKQNGKLVPSVSSLTIESRWLPAQVHNKKDKKYHLNVDFFNYDDDVSFIDYQKGDTDVYYSKVEVLSIMQAPPLYGELNDDSYIGNSATEFSKSKGSGEGSSLGGSLTAGVVVGFEQETSFLGLFKCAGAEYEFKLTGSVSYDKSTETSYDYSTGFATSGTSDAAVIFTVPYVRYNCYITTPKYVAPTEEEYLRKCAFRDELKANLEAFSETGVSQEEGEYLYGIEDYDYRYCSMVNDDNYGSQLGVLDSVSEEIYAIEEAVIECGKGGDKHWGEEVGQITLPYHYCIPQKPVITTVDVSTYDSMADYLGLEKISEKIFGDNYKAGDPGTYAHSNAELKSVEGKILSGKNNVSSEGDGFLSNNNISSSASSQTQTITVEKSEASTLGWGVNAENTSVANVGGAKVGFTVSIETNGSSVTTTTEGTEYSGTVVNLPSNTPSQYSYNWKLVAYNAKLNGSKVPVVGYLTKMPANVLPAIAEDITVDRITDTSATISWVDGNRPADYYIVSRVYEDQNEDQLVPISGQIRAVDGGCSFTITDLTPSGTTNYVIESYNKEGEKSVPTDKILITALPKNFAASLKIDGVNENVIYRSGKILNITAAIEMSKKYGVYYQWQIDEGKGWENIKGENTEKLDFVITPVYNDSKIRLSAIIMLDDVKSYKIYSNEFNLSCARTSSGFDVDWEKEKNKVFVKYAGDSAESTLVFAKKGNAYEIKDLTEDGVELNMKEDEDVKLFMWTPSLKPVASPFER